MSLERVIISQWQEYIKISKFAKLIGVSPQAVNSWLRYGTPSITIQKQKELYNIILAYMRNNFA